MGLHVVPSRGGSWGIAAGAGGRGGVDYCLQRDVQLDLRGLDVAPGCSLLSHSLEKKTEVAFCPAGQILVVINEVTAKV